MCAHDMAAHLVLVQYLVGARSTFLESRQITICASLGLRTIVYARQALNVVIYLQFE